LESHLRNEAIPHPRYPIYVARAFVAGVQGGGSGTRVNAPDVQKPVIGGAQTSQVLRIRREGKALDAKGMIRERGQWGF